MSRFFDRFPKISYDIENRQVTNLQAVTNVFFRMRMIRAALSNISSYYEYLIKNTDTPEILAENVYDDAEAHWIILMANEIVDPQYDWPLNDKQFYNFMVSKYRPVAETAYSAPNVANVQIISSGTKYANGYISFVGGSGANANARIVVDSNGSIKSVVVLNRGSAYKITDSITANVVGLETTNIANVRIVRGGTGYSNGFITISGGSGTGANANVRVNATGTIVRAFLLNGGSGYLQSDTLTASAASLGGTGANLVVNINRTYSREIANLKVNISTITDREVLNFTQTNYHHYDKVIQRTDSVTDETTEVRLKVDEANLTSNLANTLANTPYDYYNNLPETQSVVVYNFDDGKSVTEVIFRDAITYYDYEQELNEAKRSIKIIKPEYYAQIVGEFNELTKYNTTPYLRRLV